MKIRDIIEAGRAVFEDGDGSFEDDELQAWVHWFTPEHVALMDAVVDDLDLPVCRICGNVLRPLYDDIEPDVHEPDCSFGRLVAYRKAHDYC